MNAKSCFSCKRYTRNNKDEGFTCSLLHMTCSEYSLWESKYPIEVYGLEETIKNLEVEKDNVNHPTHYTQGKIEVIEVIEDWELNYLEGNIIKYVARYKYKNKIEDLKKAEWYLKRLIKGMIDAN